MKLFKASDFVNDAGLFTDAYTSADRANVIVRELIVRLETCYQNQIGKLNETIATQAKEIAELEGRLGVFKNREYEARNIEELRDELDKKGSELLRRESDLATARSEIAELNRIVTWYRLEGAVATELEGRVKAEWELATARAQIAKLREIVKQLIEAKYAPNQPRQEAARELARYDAEVAALEGKP